MKKYIIFLVVAVFVFSGCSGESGATMYLSEPSYGETEQIREQITVATTDDTTVETAYIFDPMDYVAKMTDEELVGQLFLVRCPGGSQAIEDISRYHLGGYVLFGDDFKNESVQSVSEKITSYQNASVLPLLIAVDEEGGTVTRVSRYPQFRDEKFLSPRNIYDRGGIEAITEVENEKCELLKRLGINVNLGPVCDITRNSNSFMYNRSLGQDPETTAVFVDTVVGIMAEKQVGCVLKHFPGYGDNVDTHYGIAVDNRSLEELESADLVPFQTGINSGCDSIMISHTYINAIDSELPASLSPKVVGYLRENMCFDGVIMTDDLAMGAISDQFGAEESAVIALEAGVDVLCCTDYPEHYQAVLDALKSGRLSRDQLEESASRIIQWKYQLGLL